MASKSSYSEGEKGAEVEDQLDALDKAVERLRVMYEQYFLGMSKQPPSHLHTDAERKVRELTQLQLRNTALRASCPWAPPPSWAGWRQAAS